MNTKTYEYVKKTAATSSECKSTTCDIPPFCRNNYFTGKLLTERDLTAEQRYLSDKLRLHHVALHGWGVICGLRVRSHPYCPDKRVIVEPGLAIDPCGRFIRVLKETEVELPPPIPLPGAAKDPCPPDWPKSYPQGGYGGSYPGSGYREPETGQGYEPGRGYEPGKGYEPGQGYSAGQGAPDYGPPDKGSSYQPDRPYEQDYGDRPAPTEPCQPTVNLYFCLSYAECDDGMMPAPFDECACTGNGQKPNRICETFNLSVSTEPPKGIDEAQKRKDLCLVGDCHELYCKVLEDCPQPAALECLPLAIVKDHMLGDPVTEDRIDNTSVRPILRSTQQLDQLIYCILDKVSTKTLTRIVDLSWTHRGEYQGHDFMRMFIGDGQTPRAFEITFGAPIRPEGITRRTFEAVAVRYGDRYSGGQMEVVPARVGVNGDRLKAYLEIDRGYAERRLFGARFDLFLRLRCGHVVDDSGLPVDGELLAKIDSDGNYVVAPPTGDGVEGGLFESWIRVRTGPREEPKGAY